jgi:uncharacterized membrane protein
MSVFQRFLNSNKITLKKTFSYYIMHITVAMLVAYMVTGQLWMALTLSFLEPTVQAFAFFLHEKVWDRRLQRQKSTEVSKNVLPS